MEESEMYELTIGKQQKKLLLSAVVVLLAMGMAISGWLIVSMLQNMQDDDPFSMEREYTVTGTIIEDGKEVPCTGKITTKFSSETSIASVMTYHVNVRTSSGFEDSFSYSLMFGEDRKPTSLFTYLGKEGDYEKWKGTDKGIDVIYFLDKDSVVHHMDISRDGSDLSAEMVEKK